MWTDRRLEPDSHAPSGAREPVPTSDAPGLADSSASPSPTEAAPPPRFTFRFKGDGSTLFGITFLNLLLNVVTFGVWFPWGRIRELQYLIGQTRVSGDPLVFHGKGGELLRGVLIAFFAFIVPMYALFFLAGRGQGPANVGYLALGYVLLFLLVGFASVGSLRYRLPRTDWRGIRFGFDGRALEFLGGFLPRILAVVFSWGLAYPWYAVWRRKWMMEHARFGSARFGFEGSSKELYGKFLLCWFLGIPTIGFSMLWYMGHQQGWMWNHTRLAGARFTCNLTGSGWLRLSFENGLLALISLGLAGPWIVVRTQRFLLESLSLEGSLDLAAIGQQLQRTGGVGEGTLDVLDMDSGVDIG